MTDERPEDGLAEVIWETSRADEGTISYIGANHVAAAVRAHMAGEKTPLPKTYVLRCASCGDRATTTVLLEGFTTPVCLRHYNVWRTPDFTVAGEIAEARAEALRLPRQVEADMSDQAFAAWRSADARRGLSDHDALLAHADALTRWSERFRMAFDSEDYRTDREQP